MVAIVDEHLRGAARVGRSLDAVTTLRGEIEGWLSRRKDDQRYARFACHLDVLGTVLARMLHAVGSDLAAIDTNTSASGLVYERCRANDRRLGLIRRTYRWYIEKYDQRADERLEPTLLAADEVVRSCWTEPFFGVKAPPPTGPLVYLDARFDANATPRVSVPSDLRAPGDAVVGEFVRALPIPVIAVPASCVDEPWWLVLVAHETGHHIQQDLVPGLQEVTREALREATSALPGDESIGADWHRWALEAFADAFSVLMVGTAAGWAVEELQHASPRLLVTLPEPGDRYPPPAVRVALLGELARLAGMPDPGRGADEVRAWLDAVPAVEVAPQARDVVVRHLAVTHVAAATLVNLPVSNHSLRELCAVAAQRYTPGNDIPRWAERLVQDAPTIAQRQKRVAARTGITAGVRAFLDATATQNTGRLDRLRRNLADVLATCGPSGVLAQAPAVRVDDLADQLADRLLAVTDEEG
jgi:hypothetical protein